MRPAAFAHVSQSGRDADFVCAPRRGACKRSGVVCRAAENGSGKALRPPYNVLITGSTKGIGLALAKRHLQEGDNVVICSRSDDAVKAVTRALRDDFGTGRVVGRPCNVAKAGDVASLAAYAQDELGSVDLWINNAGTNAYMYKTLIDTAETDLSEIVDTNVLGVMLCCQAAIKAMRKQTLGGHIFNMDGAGSDGNATPRFAAYGATKRSLAQLRKSLEAEMAMVGISNVGVHDLSPGMVTTELLMAGADTPTAKFFINCLAETPDVVADYLVPRVRDVPLQKAFGDKVPSGTYIRFLTQAKALGNISLRLALGKNKGRYVSED